MNFGTQWTFLDLVKICLSDTNWNLKCGGKKSGFNELSMDVGVINFSQSIRKLNKT